MTHSVTRYHDISCGHRVAHHESKCRHLHGHNYRVHFTCVSEDDALDSLGRVIDFGVIKALLCEWLENNWDHKFLMWQEDPKLDDLAMLFPADVVVVPFNPTAENMAEYLVETIGPMVLSGSGVSLIRVSIEETRKCSAAYRLPRWD